MINNQTHDLRIKVTVQYAVNAKQRTQWLASTRICAVFSVKVFSSFLKSGLSCVGQY